LSCLPALLTILGASKTHLFVYFIYLLEKLPSKANNNILKYVWKQKKLVD